MYVNLMLVEIKLFQVSGGQWWLAWVAVDRDGDWVGRGQFQVIFVFITGNDGWRG